MRWLRPDSTEYMYTTLSSLDSGGGGGSHVGIYSIPLLFHVLGVRNYIYMQNVFYLVH